MTRLVLNVGGEGEFEDAIDVNSLVLPLRRPESWIRPGRFIRADIRAVPIREGVATDVVGRKLPMMDSADRRRVVREVARVLVIGGSVRLHASSGGGQVWLPLLEDAGLGTGTLDGIYARGMKAR